MDIPAGLSMPDSSKIIVDVEQRIFDGKAITNRKRCGDYNNQGIRYFRQPKKYVPIEDNKVANIFYPIAFCLVGLGMFVLIGIGLVRVVHWIF